MSLIVFEDSKEKDAVPKGALDTFLTIAYLLGCFICAIISLAVIVLVLGVVAWVVWLYFTK